LNIDYPKVTISNTLHFKFHFPAFFSFRSRNETIQCTSSFTSTSRKYSVITLGGIYDAKLSFLTSRTAPVTFLIHGMQFLVQCLRRAYILNGVIADIAIHRSCFCAHCALMQSDYHVVREMDSVYMYTLVHQCLRANGLLRILSHHANTHRVWTEWSVKPCRAPAVNWRI